MLFETVRAPRMAGRAFGRLMVWDPPEQSAEGRPGAVGASGGGDQHDDAVAPGRRRRRAPEPADRALAPLAYEPPHVRLRLEGMRDAHAFFQRKLPNLIERLPREPIGRDDGREMRDD
ncbi:MAG: hypothetical protein ACYS5V_06135 [Planctomycetota bacterium]|jgi:hypothetical protein